MPQLRASPFADSGSNVERKGYDSYESNASPQRHAEYMESGVLLSLASIEAALKDNSMTTYSACNKQKKQNTYVRLRIITCVFFFFCKHFV